VFIFGQQHARKWATPLVCVETAERLLRNYTLDPAAARPLAASPTTGW
jgi:hypothetical protein